MADIIDGVEGLKVGSALFAKPSMMEDKYCNARLPKADGARLIESIELGMPELKSSTFTPSFYTYKVLIKCSPDLNVDSVERRYSEFIWLHEWLVKLFPGIFIPPIPPKKVIGNKEAGFVAERREDLQRFLQRCVDRKYITDSLPFQMFVSRPGFDAGKKAVEKDLKNWTHANNVEVFKELFPELDSADLPANAEERIAELGKFAEAAELRLSALHATTHSIGIGWLNMIKDTSIMSEELTALKDLESDFVLRPDPPRPDLSAVMTQWSDSVKQIAPVYYTHLYTTFKHELQDSQGMIKMLKYRQQLYEECGKAVTTAQQWKGTNYQAKETPKSMAQKAFDLENEKSLLALMDLTTKLILNYELPLRWNAKVLRYHENMLYFSKAQHVNVTKLTGVWGDVKEILGE